jgi:putative CocE/NonD family hydrolase
MKIKTNMPRPIREIENIWIPLSDGTRLAARIWLPVDAEQQPVPAILEYLPYRKNDGTAMRDSIRHPNFAGHGYACIRVDMRGSGDSDGILYDEYLPQEQIDGLEILRWLAAQPWCTGDVGIIGISWGGFNGLQIAAHRPPELKAIITLCSTDDRYADDVHYMGGCLLGSDMPVWASTMLALNAQPPDPRFVGERWRDLWLDRLERTPPYIETWLAHQRRDAFWQQGSVCENYADITCAVYAVGGWADGYTNAIPRLLAGLTCPRKGLIGPWSHNYPEKGRPGPAIGFQQECLRWWDYWLKGIDTGIMAEPMLRAWLQESVPPSDHYLTRPGRWVAESSWPSPNIASQEYAFNPDKTLINPKDEGGRMKDENKKDFPSSLILHPSSFPQTLGFSAGVWCPYGVPGDFPTDQRQEDGFCLSFTSIPLDAPLDILGFPEVNLTLAVDRPKALVAVRLCDVAPDGASTLVSWGLLNLTHRESHEFPTPLEPGQRYPVTVRLNAIGHTILPGHRWRVAVSTTYWPHAWPSPEGVRLSVFTQGSGLTLPVRPPRPEDANLPAFGEPEGSAPLDLEILRSGGRRRTIERNINTGWQTLVDHDDDGRYRFAANGLEVESWKTDTWTILEGDPLSAAARCQWLIAIGRDNWRTRLETDSLLTADATTFHTTNRLDAYEGETRVFSKTWTFSVPRDEV